MIRARHALFCLVALGSVHAGPSAADGGEKPIDVLLRAARLEDSAVGYGAQRTATYAAFAELYAQGSAAQADAERLIEQGTPAGRVYGYIVLRHVAPASARSHSPALLADGAGVDVQSGCLTETRTVGEIVQALNQGREVIALPREPAMAFAGPPEPAAGDCPER